MRIFLGVLIGVVITYILGAIIAWDYNPGEWNGLWRFLCVCFAIFWGVIGGMIGNDYKPARPRRKVPVVIDNRG